MLRRFILEGVDVLPSLSGKSVTGGRLNIQKALSLMDDYCFGRMSIDPFVEQPMIRVFPNPAISGIQVISDRPIESIACTDMLGKTVTLEPSRDGVYNVEFLSSGIYLLSLTIQGQNHKIKWNKL